jgi:riboflavin biosynthesis pyrimidine reductase
LILQELYPNPDATHEVEDISSDSLKHLYPKVPGFRFNYVIDPQVFEEDSGLATSPLDRLILKFIRSQSDLIVTTGATAIAETLNSSSFAPMLILTQSDDELDIPALTKESSRQVYVTQKLETSYPNSKAMAIGKITSNAASFCKDFCKLNGFESIALESGLSVTSEFAQAGLLSEIDITVARVKDQEIAQGVAYSLIQKLTSSLPLHERQLLHYQDNWFFRFDSPKAMS